MTNEEVVEQLVWCNDRIDDITYAPKAIEALDIAIKELESNKWIPVSERLPENDTPILATIKSFHYRCRVVRSGWYSNRLFMIDNGECWRTTDKELIAWMTAPLPYKGKKKEYLDMEVSDNA